MTLHKWHPRVSRDNPRPLRAPLPAFHGSQVSSVQRHPMQSGTVTWPCLGVSAGPLAVVLLCFPSPAYPRVLSPLTFRSHPKVYSAILTCLDSFGTLAKPDHRSCDLWPQIEKTEPNRRSFWASVPIAVRPLVLRVHAAPMIPFPSPSWMWVGLYSALPHRLYS